MSEQQYHEDVQEIIKRGSKFLKNKTYTVTFGEKMAEIPSIKEIILEGSKNLKNRFYNPKEAFN